MPDPTVTLPMFWTVCLFTAQNEYNLNRVRAQDVMEARDEDMEDVSAEDVAEELARTHFPTGTTTGLVGWYLMSRDGVPYAWATDRDVYDTFEEFVTDLRASDGRLDPRDPAHIALVARALALLDGLPLYPEGPAIRVKLDAALHSGPDVPRPDILGYRLILDRTRPDHGPYPLALYYEVPYQPGETAETVKVDVGALLFCWFAERVAEVEQALARAEEADEELEPANNVVALA